MKLHLGLNLSLSFSLISTSTPAMCYVNVTVGGMVSKGQGLKDMDLRVVVLDIQKGHHLLTLHDPETLRQ
jgi:hypothetical protein